MQTSYGRHDHRGRHRYSSRLCARQHGRDHRVPVGRVRDRTVHRLAAPAPPRTARRRVTYRAAVARWPRACITLRQGARVVMKTWTTPCISLTRRSQRLSFLIAFAQYLFDSLHDWHLEIFLVAAEVGHFAHVLFERLQIKHSVIAFGIIITAEPCSDEPRLTDFVMHELITVEFRNIDCHLGLGRRACAGARHSAGTSNGCTTCRLRGAVYVRREIPAWLSNPADACSWEPRRLEPISLSFLRPPARGSISSPIPRGSNPWA